MPIIILIVITYLPEKPHEKIVKEQNCYKTCKFRVVETIPTNITFGDSPLPMSTYRAWSHLIKSAREELFIAAYKSSLQGKHVLGDMDKLFSNEGDAIYGNIMSVGKTGEVNIRMIENYPPKDKGDNADGVILQNYGAVHRKSIDISHYMGRGKMHSKFMIADRKHFYLGSANLDWRSLNQKMELGLLIEDCECLGEDLYNIFDVLWHLKETGLNNNKPLQRNAAYNKERPLSVQIQGKPAKVYIATSPKELNNPRRTWDLDAIVHEIDSAKQFIDIHVMDYFPLFLYRNPKVHFAIIDDAIRRAIVRGVQIRMLAAALHYPDIGTRFLRSLESLNNVYANGTMQVKIFKVPTANVESIVINRERRTHNKFMVTESAVIIGTSNWSGDYFMGGTTGAAIVIRQTGKTRPFEIFNRDWNSEYAHPLDEYFEKCVETDIGEFCEGKKDPTLFASPESSQE
ncbi:unnamed protein product [Caenorhabditis bovis]|uniref:PLD phosphodiesterase domain-containing protein n=1 Tax=Caenorhabditis bovis TaxID=2654633 RepID=A0A8S1ED29_9PELO|nr:unnamed protein product [Caenorhabditis bovis]